MRRQLCSTAKWAFRHRTKQFSVLQPRCIPYSSLYRQQPFSLPYHHRFVSSTSDKVPEPKVKVTEEPQDDYDTSMDVDVEAEGKSTLQGPPQTEKIVGDGTNHSFQAETKRLLEIVARSLYTDKEIFIRELISNASDALEKARYLQNTKSLLGDEELSIKIHLDEGENTITITDTGVGMTSQELISDLGTIARSGSKQFVEKLEKSGDGQDIIGQFGVGFYSTFMVADKVEVFTSCADPATNDGEWAWTSSGLEDYTLTKASGVSRGTKIIVHLKDACKEFSLKHHVEGVLKKHSTFVGFPIFLGDEQFNTVGALWTKPQNEVSEEDHTGFYRHIANAYDSPSFRLHFKTDVPIDLNALFYFPERHMEKYGMGRLDPGVSLYCRKVLIQPSSKLILPDWLRFVKGVVDSEDIPLNISRENMQDSALIKRMNNVLTKKCIRFLAEKGKKDSEVYQVWFKEFGNFIKEGVCSDFQNKNDIAKLLRFDSSVSDDAYVSLDEYISRMPPSQKKVYFLNAPNREIALESPYYESFKAEKTEVLFLYSAIDDFVMKNLGKYNQRDLVSAESGSVDFKDSKEEEKKEDSADQISLVEFFAKSLGDKVASVNVTKRPINAPAIIVDHESSSYRKMMQYVNNDPTQATPITKQKLEINPHHKICKQLLGLKDNNPDIATLISEQVFDNALMAADILDKPQTMIHRLNKILEHASAK